MSAQVLMSAYLNDPGVQGETPEAADPGTSAALFSIPGLPAKGPYDALEPKTPEFEASHLTVILTHAHDAWQGYFGVPFDWQMGKVLPIVPRAGLDLNAYYDRTALKYFYATDPNSKVTLYTCESSDVAAHECGHAILDAHHPDYWDSLHPETGAFHEAFGDITALLTTLQFPSVREALLKETKGDLHQSNDVSRLAEQLGKELYVLYGKDASGATFLRDLYNDFKYKETYNLPSKAPADKLSSESHSFSRIFSGAFYDIFAGMYDVIRAADAKLSADDALVQARDDAGKLLANALVLAPPGDAVYRVIASSILKASQQLFGDKYFAVLKKVFTERKILLVKEANVFKPHTQTIGAKSSAVNLGLLSLDNTSDRPAPPEELQRALHLHKEETVFTRELRRMRDEKIVQYHAQRYISLRGKQYGAADGARVPIQGGLTLNVDDMGMVAFSGFYRAGVDDVRAIRDHVEKLAEKNRIYPAHPGDDADLMHLITRGQSYYIDYDAQGNKILRRAYVECVNDWGSKERRVQ